MAGSHTTPSARRRIDLGAVARQANQVVAAAVFVFGASILLGSVLSTPVLTPAMAWILRHWGETAGVILGPLFIDGMYVVLLLAVAFPFGRVTAARPWISGPALVLLVYGFWFSFHYVTGDAAVLYDHWAKIAARAVLMLLTVYGVARLMARGRRAALEVDRPDGSARDGEPPQKKKETGAQNAQEREKKKGEAGAEAGAEAGGKDKERDAEEGGEKFSPDSEEMDDPGSPGALGARRARTAARDPGPPGGFAAERKDLPDKREDLPEICKRSALGTVLGGVR